MVSMIMIHVWFFLTLLGLPGVGKTYLVDKSAPSSRSPPCKRLIGLERTAISMKRPLLSLTIADIGINEERVETELTTWFFLAQRWKAVLLVDEADIFLERRKPYDNSRNAIVSGIEVMTIFSELS